MTHGQWLSGPVARKVADLQPPNNSASEVNTGHALDAFQACSWSWAAFQKTTAIVGALYGTPRTPRVDQYLVPFSCLYNTVRPHGAGKCPTHREDESRAGLGWRQRKQSSRLRRTVSKVTQPVVPSKGCCVFEVATLCFQCKVGGTVVCPGQPDQVGGYPELDGPCLLFCF